MKDPINIAIAGATGYIGLELIKILSKHPKVKILYLCANKSAGKSIHTFDKRINKKNLPKISRIENVNWNELNILFTSLPNGKAQKIAKVLPDHIKLIDLSANNIKRYSNRELSFRKLKAFSRFFMTVFFTLNSSRVSCGKFFFF